MNKTAITGATVLTAIAAAVVLGTTWLGDDSSTPLVTTVLGFIGLAVTQLVGQKSIDSAKETVEELNQDLHNGTFERLLREAIKKVAEDESTKLEIHQDTPDNKTEGGRF